MKHFALSSTLAATLLTCSSLAHATIVQVKTNLGDFEINLFDQSTPVTVTNFLTYSNAGRFDNTVIHRSVPGFVIQGGGFTFDQQLPLKATATNAPIVNEPKWSNIRGTVAMAKQAGNPNSATNQWFVNLTNNGANLDLQNGGFTVFGQIDAQGMEVVDAIAALQRFSFNGIADLPLQNYTSNDRDDNKALVASNLVTIESVVVVDNRVDSAANVTKVPRTTGSTGSDNSVSSGTTGIAALFGLLLLAVRRRIFG